MASASVVLVTVVVDFCLPLVANAVAYSCTRGRCSENDSAVIATLVVAVGASMTGALIALWHQHSRWLGKSILLGLGVTVVCYAALLMLVASQMD